MPPKGKKGKKGKKQAEEVERDENAITEVDKTFYELEITDLNRKLARLRELTATLEDKNTELETKYVQLDEDRADVIAYLKKQLSEKQTEAKELQERLYALQEAKDTEAENYEQRIKDMEEEYRVMKEQLMSDVKLVSGKLNALEEFRVHRDELMKKYLDQEAAIEEQEIRHKRVIYEKEKEFIMSKDTIKKDMEKRIIELASDFQAANEIRIAATTHRVIRENIAINNEMDKLQDIIERLTKENDELKFKNRNLKQNCDLYQEETNIALGDTKVHRGVIKQLKFKYKNLAEEVETYKSSIKEAKAKDTELYMSRKEIENLNFKVRILEQNLHATKCETLAARRLLQEAQAKAKQLTSILFEALDAIEQSLKITLTDVDESTKYSKRESLLYYLLRLINEGHKEIIRVESSDTIESVKAAYIKGDLGLVPKDLPTRKRSPMRYNMETQVGASLEELHKLGLEPERHLSMTSSVGSFLPSVTSTTMSREEQADQKSSETSMFDESLGKSLEGESVSSESSTVTRVTALEGMEELEEALAEMEGLGEEMLGEMSYRERSMVSGVDASVASESEDQ